MKNFILNIKKTFLIGFKDGYEQPYELTSGMTYPSQIKQLAWDLGSRLGQLRGKNKFTPVETAYREKAKILFHCEGEIEVDDNAKVSVSEGPYGENNGAYVQAWVWVPKPERKS